MDESLNGCSQEQKINLGKITIILLKKGANKADVEHLWNQRMCSFDCKTAAQLTEGAKERHCWLIILFTGLFTARLVLQKETWNQIDTDGLYLALLCNCSFTIAVFFQGLTQK